ncbi:two-component sensor histidine kinase [[Clostridium] sordellii]|uniref:sensor histidine kinase n=1 Tax=Paraclostridium sordellii TaxID=1505 RepID=UPI0005E7195F|nr:HAMP domain-containing sensor histidine kinase [Paeniclostridium sordellii]CEO13433.1 two-component sensor histidine kinase [[Clostridium] sordellii] [Paeniclostridium sordellii]CEP89015.1 two-component sensor histidine kinase [[Clostridium] sordellii] [Paeniclostridium sordellii]CEP97905.1 two-component sensor histidine kinase [[Clostridium] sordellii] [Paeniclostridium sordellii]CEQ01293.1 two-component sensor histidine kinase [[Clostridium] sordellii] [Paeniclostridium sordellii]
MLDIKLIRRRNLIALSICFCISIISLNIQNIYFDIDYLNKNFYKSYEFEQALYEIATNSVYTVVGDSASEKMINYRNESRKFISDNTCAQIFIINNKSNEIYSNNIFEFNKYMKSIESYAEMYEINFKQNSMYKLVNGGKVRVSTNHFGNLAQARKEDVTTYIAIPYTYDIRGYKDTNDREPLYIRYIQFIKNKRDSNIIIGSKIIALLILLVYLVLYIVKNKGQNKKVIFKNIVLILLALIFSILQSKVYGWSILYPIINTTLLYIVYYSSKLLLRDKEKEELFSETLISKKLYELKRRNTIIYTLVKYAWIFILILTMQVFEIFTFDTNHLGQEFIIYNSPFIYITLCLVSILIIIDKIKKIEKIRTGISEIKNGNIEYKIEIKKDSLFNDIVCDINEMRKTINLAVEERLKSERMKNELITNVSHDLKTPLTAMINYISLMKNEDIQPYYIKDYVQVLDKRSQRLKNLIEDLFEASKIGSNNIELDIKETDINQLLTQTLVEMEEYIDESELEFIVNIPEHEVYILADGKKTFRVFENIISNILKYSLEGTRVYLDLEEKNDKVYISFKNISKYKLNFNPYEITERFTRGDLSRNTEGSGLGLAISKGFVEAQNGNLKVDIIGDLFIVNIDFDLSQINNL